MESEIEIPEEVRQVYAQWRPSPLFRARRLEKALDTPAKIYYKYEGVSPAGSHKPNTAVAQAYYNKQEGTKRLATETGAGQWGSSLAMACAFFGLECKVYMVRVSYNQKPYRRALMEAFGASVTASPSNETDSGRAILAQHPESNGSLGIAISEAVEVAAKDPDTKYALGTRIESRAAAPDRDRPGSDRADGASRRRSRRDCRLHRRRFELRRHGDALPWAQAARRKQRPRGRRRTRRVPQPDQGPIHLRFRRHRTPDATGQNAHPRQHVHPSRHPRRRACAITAWRRWCARPSTSA